MLAFVVLLHYLTTFILCYVMLIVGRYYTRYYMASDAFFLMKDQSEGAENLSKLSLLLHLNWN